MKKNHVLLLFLFILGGVLFVGCHDDEPDMLPDPENAGINEMLNGITDPEVRKAIAWFEEHGQDASLARTGETHPLFSMMIPAWSYAFVRSSNDEYRTVEVPIWAYSRTLFTLPENAIAYDKTGNSMYIQSLTRLVILTDKKKGTIQGFFMTLIPSKEYMDAKNFNVYRSTYLSREKDFDGYVYFHELDGSLANGWRYSNGKITHTVKMIENSGLARGGHYEYVTYCYPVYRRVCTGYWQTTESGGREYVEVNCYEEYVRDECHTEAVWVQDPDPEPGSGGGFHPNPDPATPSEGDVASDWWGPTHNNIIKNSLGDKLTAEQLELVKAGSAEADKFPYQEIEYANMHAMTIPGQTCDQTIAGMRENFEKYATDFFERGTNYKDLGFALHMIMDTYSPAHNLKVWKNNAWSYIPHAFEAGFLHYKKVNKAEQAVAEVYADLINSDYNNAGEVFDAWVNGHLGPLHPDNQK